MLLKKPGQFAVGSATQSGAGLLDLNFLNSDATLSNTITHSRSGNATMVASDGLIKWAPHNLLPYSEEFDNAAWTKSGSFSSSQVINAATAPDGSLSAEEYTNNDTGTNNLQASLAVSATDYTFSIWLKAKSAGDVGKYVTVGGHISGSKHNRVLVQLTADWTKFSVSGTTTAASWSWGVDGRTNGVFTGLNQTQEEASFYAWGAHLYRSDLGGMVDVPAGERVIPSASTYVPTTSSARYLPRVGHHVYNGSAWVNEGVLAESEPRTNLYENNDDPTNDDLVSNVTVTASQTNALTGGNDAFLLTVSLTGTARTGQSVSVTSGVTYVSSRYVKAGSTNFAQISMGGTGFGADVYANFDLSSGSIATESNCEAQISDEGNGWYRCSVSAAATATLSTTSPNYLTPVNSGTAAVRTGVSGNSVYFYGVQIEAAPTPSSYIPTAGSTVTRAAETFLIPAANLPYSSVAMSIQMNGRLSYADEGSAGQVTYAQWEDDTNNRITLSLDTDSTATGEVNFTQVEGGTADTVASSATEYAPGILVPYNIASRHGITFINGAVDGVALTANTTPTNLPDLSATDLNLAYDYMGTVERFRIWGLDLGDGGIEGASS